MWDVFHNSISVYHNLTNDYFYPSDAALMRIHLSVEVLNADMLNLMEVICDCTINHEHRCDRKSDFIAKIKVPWGKH